MSHANEGIIRKIHSAFSSGQHPDASLFAVDVVWHVEGHNPLARTYRGRDEVFAAFRAFETASGKTLCVHLMSVAANDEYALAVLHASGTRNGQRYESCEYDVYRIAQGAVLEFWSFSANQHATDAFWSQI